MKSILQPIKPQYCELIVAGKKTIEVRKTRPKIETPFKVYIYETKDKKYENIGFCYPDKNIKFIHAPGKVIGEYVCDKIIKYSPLHSGEGYIIPYLQQALCCLSHKQLWKYGKGKILYGWYISDLVIYDKPRELREFGKECNLDCQSVRCPYWKYQRVNADEWDYDCSCNNIKPLTRPPQSWCFVEEV